jgi:hypothetical protein
VVAGAKRQRHRAGVPKPPKIQTFYSKPLYFYMLFSIPNSKFKKGSPIDGIGGKKCVGISSLLPLFRSSPLPLLLFFLSFRFLISFGFVSILTLKLFFLADEFWIAIMLCCR